MNDSFEPILHIIPEKLKNFMTVNHLTDNFEEIRLRVNQNAEIYTFSGGIKTDINIGGQDILSIIKSCTNHSLYAHEDEIKNGYITIGGGHRIGFTGRVLHKDGEIVTIDHFNSLNIRAAREIKGCANPMIKYIVQNGKVSSVLIVSPPQTGKTTLLRDIARILSNGTSSFKGVKVGLIDERGEIAACIDGVPQLDVGFRTDVLDGCPKAKGMILLIRSMSPDVIITDEIGGEEDFISITNASASGVSVIATAHGNDLNELLSKPYMKKILDGRFFSHYLFIKRENNKISAHKIYSHDFQEVKWFD